MDSRVLDCLRRSHLNRFRRRVRSRAEHLIGIEVHLLQVYSNSSMNRVSPQKLLFRSAGDVRDAGVQQSAHRIARQLRAHDIDELVDRYRVVRNVRQVAREFRISRATAAKHLGDRGVDTSPGMSPADIEAAVRLYLGGLSSGRIGQQLGFDNHTILKAIRSAGIKVRQPVAPRPKM